MPPFESAALLVKVAQTMDSGAVWERDLNFGGGGEQLLEEEEESLRRRSSRDPMSHRIIEKRRRDRMNSCLADLSRLIPAEYLKRGRGRIEKTEIIQMAIRHMRHLQESRSFLSPSPHSSFASPTSSSSTSSSSSNNTITTNCRQEVSNAAEDSSGNFGRVGSSVAVGGESGNEQYRLGFLECLSETLHFLIEVEGFPASGSLCFSLNTHLRGHYAAMLKVSEEESEPITQQTENHDYEEIVSSELKVMLTRRKEDECGSSSNSLQSLSSVCKENGASYKFKNNIKRRFTAGLEKRKKTEGGEEIEDKKCCKDTSVFITNSTFPPHTAYLQPDAVNKHTSHSRYHEMSPLRIPVFALHSERSFYVPLMLDPEALAPHASLLSKQASALHPVTISVNFCSGGQDKCDSDKSNATLFSSSRGLLSSTVPSPLLSLSMNSQREWKSSES